MQKWEYLRITTGYDVNIGENLVSLVNGEKFDSNSEWRTFNAVPSLDNFLIEAGERGWELVAQNGIQLLFKRPKPD